MKQKSELERMAYAKAITIGFFLMLAGLVVNGIQELIETSQPLNSSIVFAVSVSVLSLIVYWMEKRKHRDLHQQKILLTVVQGFLVVVVLGIGILQAIG